jgi:hypothetical protein
MSMTDTIFGRWDFAVADDVKHLLLMLLICQISNDIDELPFLIHQDQVVALTT